MMNRNNLTADQKPVLSDELLKLQWMTFDEALSHIKQGDSLRRLIEKSRP